MDKAVHLEDAIERIGNIPHDIRRQMELIRALDLQWVSQLKELKSQQNAYLDRARRLVKGKPRDGSVNLRELVEDAPALEKIKALRKERQQLADEKVQVRISSV